MGTDLTRIYSLTNLSSRLRSDACLLLLASTAVLSCTSNTPTTTSGDTADGIDDNKYSFEGTSKPEALSAEELSAYKADRAYIRSLARPKVPFTINHADDRQHRFVMLRLKMGGKTPENSPQLFELLEQMRAEQLHSDQPSESGSVRMLSGNNPHALSTMHYFSLISTTDSSHMIVVANHSSKDSLYYGYVDAGTWDANGTALGNMTYREVYGNMPSAQAAATGNLTLAQVKEYEGDSLFIEDTVSYGHKETYLFDVSCDATSGPRGTPGLNVHIDDPADTRPVPPAALDGNIRICISRTASDCDYGPIAAPDGSLRLPLKGSISIAAANASIYKFDTTKLQEYKNSSTPVGGYISINLPKLGGGCDLQGAGALTNGMRSFWSSVKFTDTTLSWDMTGSNIAVFDGTCFMSQSLIYLNMDINLPFLKNGAPIPSHIFISNNNPSTNPSSSPSCLVTLPQTIQIVNSCLAAGTTIEMSDGQMVPIESIHAGDHVYNPYHRNDSALSVVDTPKGVELVPMVRIADEHGRSLLLTEMHPIQVVGRGMVQARRLQTGDVVMTKDGQSRLTSVTRQQYDGTVHNLKLGTSDEKQSLGSDQTVVYANGFLVGDAQIQGKYEAIELEAKPQLHALTRLPKRWRKDYLNSARR